MPFESKRRIRAVVSFASFPRFSTRKATFTDAVPVVTSGVETKTLHRAKRTGPVVLSHTCRYMPEPEYQRLLRPSFFTRTAMTFSPRFRCGVRSYEKVV